MRLLLAFACLAAVVVAGPLFRHGRFKDGFLSTPRLPEGMDPLPAQWFTQKVDHFDAQHLLTYQQRYFVNSQYYKPGGPVFLLIGGEGTANPSWLQAQTSLVTWAQEFNGLLFSLEHRYYGVSQPFADISTEHLQHLSSEQALADLATFRNAMMTQYQMPSDTKWVAVGGSYSGAMAAWARIKYPHLFAVAVATSSPLYPEINFSSYLQVVNASLARFGGEQCIANIAAAVNLLNAEMQTQNGLASLSSQFKTCSSLTTANANDIMNFASTLAGNFEGVVQYNSDNRAFEGAVDVNVTIPVICGLMNDQSVDPLQRYANVNSLIMNTYGQSCLDFSYADLISGYQNTTLTSAMSGSRQWFYQTCTEFGWYQSSDAAGTPWNTNAFPISFWVQQCADVFGPSFNLQNLQQGVQWTLDNYGGRSIAVSNIIIPNGSVDPWHAESLISSADPTVPAIFIDGTAHCADLYPASPNDPISLTVARQKIFAYLQTMLSA